MSVSPQSLRQICVQCLRQSIHSQSQTNETTNDGHNDSLADTSAAKSPFDCSLSGHLAEELLHELSANGELTDDVLLQPVFSCRCTRLRCVRISDASQLTAKGLRALKTHRLRALEVSGLSKCTINELIGCLGDHSLQRLNSLNVSRSAFTSSNKFCVVVGLAKLQSLQSLDVSHTDFNHHGLEIVVEDLPVLSHLNISATRVRDLTPLRKCRERLKSLSVYNLKSTSGRFDEFVPVLTELEHLLHLDISDDSDNPLEMLGQTRPHDRTIASLLRSSDKHFMRLRSLDLSGRDGVDSAELIKFLKRKHENYNNNNNNNESTPSLRFLGLMQCSAAFDEHILSAKEWYDSDLTITGNASEEQIKESLRRYCLRPAFVQKSLFHLYNYTLTYSEPRTDLIHLICSPMRRHSKVLQIQMAATACLYNLTKNELGDRIHPKHLQLVVDSTLHAMQTFPNHLQLQKNALLTLCSDRILQDVSIDRFRCTQLVLDSLVTFKETAMNRMAVAICSILAAKISTTETSHLGAKPVYMEALLDIVRGRVTAQTDNDIMLKFTLSALWNLTDESPKTCQMFLEKGGMDLYLLVLKTFEGECAVETKVLGLLNNIAEVSVLRTNLMNTEFLEALRHLMRSPKIDVSYFAAGIFAHLCCDGLQNWSYAIIDLNAVLEELVSVVLNWETPEIEMVAYRSFLPFIPLLNCFESPAVQLWAIWAIHHVCSKNPKRYCEMLIEENGAKTIKTIFDYMSQSDDNQSLKTYCRQTLDVIRKEFPNFDVC